MNKTVRTWFEQLYKQEIEEVDATINNERVLELGYAGEGPNPHTKNIEMLSEYREMLEDGLSELN